MFIDQLIEYLTGLAAQYPQFADYINQLISRLQGLA